MIIAESSNRNRNRRPTVLQNWLYQCDRVITYAEMVYACITHGSRNNLLRGDLTAAVRSNSESYNRNRNRSREPTVRSKMAVLLCGRVIRGVEMARILFCRRYRSHDHLYILNGWASRGMRSTQRRHSLDNVVTYHYSIIKTIWTLVVGLLLNATISTTTPAAQMWNREENDRYRDLRCFVAGCKPCAWVSQDAARLKVV